MEIIYIVQAHKEPQQLLRLITALSSENVFFYIHIDKKTELEPFKKAIRVKKVFFIDERVDCIWGDFSQVLATLSLIKKVVQEKRDGMVILISGQDYPIKSTEHIKNFFTDHKDENFISVVPINELWSPKECTDRTKYYRFNFSSLKGHYKILLYPGFKALQLLLFRKISLQQFFLLFKKRELKLAVKFYSGSQWWAFNSKTLGVLYRYIKENQGPLFSYFQYTHCADEIFFHSIINHLRERDDSIKIKKTITYVNWERKNSTLPVTFNQNDLDELISQPADLLFARKFDIEFDCHILDLLDKGILSQ